jgi:hypothetical protein
MKSQYEDDNDMKLGSVIATMIWVVGVVLAKGFWSTFFAVIVPFYSWFLVASYLVERYL